MLHSETGFHLSRRHGPEHICVIVVTQANLQKQALGSFPVTSSLGIAAPEVFATASPNPVVNTSRLTYRVQSPSQIIDYCYQMHQVKPVKVLANKKQDAGNYTIEWNAGSLVKGSYFISISKNGEVKQTLPLIKAE